MLIKKYGPLVLSSFIGASACFVLTQTDLVSKAHAAKNSQCEWFEENSWNDFKKQFDRYVTEGWEFKTANAFIGKTSGDRDWLWHFAVFCR